MMGVISMMGIIRIILKYLQPFGVKWFKRRVCFQRVIPLKVRTYSRFGNQPGKYYVYYHPDVYEYRSFKAAQALGFVADE